MTDPIVPPAQPTPPAYAAAGTPATFPGKTLGIVAIPVAIFFSLIGIILGFVAKGQSKAAGVKNTPATIAIVIGFIALAISIIVGIGVGVGAAALMSQCAELGSGVHEVNGVTYTCS